ncbi:MAG: ABC transporter ATP-binding protein [Verrucomicrobiota bacterium]
MRVSIQNLVKKFGDTVALKGISLEIQSEELFFLLGPSGCGKTTLLRTIAGFYQPDGGQLLFGDKPMAGVPPHLRNTGMVFQNYALWPHMTVAQNVAYGLDVRSVNEAEKKQRVQNALEIVRMESYAARTPDKLSGGQQQRVALARALVINPDVLLLDEPLSNLDAKLRLEMREEIRRIHAQTKITTIYVTHDQKEALSLASRMAVLRDGKIEQLGDPRAIYRTPANRFVADFIGETNWLTATVERHTGGEMTLATSAGPLVAVADVRWQPGARVLAGFRPESVEIGESAVNRFATRISYVCYLGEVEQYELVIPGGERIKAFEQNPDHIRQVGAALSVYVRPQNIMVLPAE